MDRIAQLLQSLLGRQKPLSPLGADTNATIMQRQKAAALAYGLDKPTDYSQTGGGSVLGAYTSPTATPTPTPQPLPTSTAIPGFLERQRRPPPPDWIPLILSAASSSGIHPAIIASQLFSESGFNANARNVNSNGSEDVGPAQVNLQAHPEVTREQAFDPNFAIPWLADQVARQLKVQGNLPPAIAAYNVGPGRVGQGEGRDQYGLGPFGRKYVNKVVAGVDPQVLQSLGMLTSY